MEYLGGNKQMTIKELKELVRRLRDNALTQMENTSECNPYWNYQDGKATAYLIILDYLKDTNG